MGYPILVHTNSESEDLRGEKNLPMSSERSTEIDRFDFAETYGCFEPDE